MIPHAKRLLALAWLASCLMGCGALMGPGADFRTLLQTRRSITSMAVASETMFFVVDRQEIWSAPLAQPSNTTTRYRAKTPLALFEVRAFGDGVYFEETSSDLPLGSRTFHLEATGEPVDVEVEGKTVLSVDDAAFYFVDGEGHHVRVLSAKTTDATDVKVLAELEVGGYGGLPALSAIVAGPKDVFAGGQAGVYRIPKTGGVAKRLTERGVSRLLLHRDRIFGCTPTGGMISSRVDGTAFVEHPSRIGCESMAARGPHLFVGGVRRIDLDEQDRFGNGEGVVLARFGRTVTLVPVAGGIYGATADGRVVFVPVKGL